MNNKDVPVRIIFYCRDCDRTDTTSLPSIQCANCKKEMVDIGWEQGLRLNE